MDKQPFQDRLNQTENAVARRLMQLMVAKKTNLCIALDFQHSAVLLEMARKVADWRWRRRLMQLMVAKKTNLCIALDTLRCSTGDGQKGR